MPRGASPEKPRLACPERNQCVAFWSSAAARMQKLDFRQPSHSTASSDIPDTTTCTYCCCQTQTQQWQSSVNPRVKRWSSFTAVFSHRPRLRLSLTQPTELLVTFLGTGPRHGPSSTVPPEEVRRRTEPDWGQSESLCRLQAGCGLAAAGGIATVHCFHSSATSCSILLCSTPSA